MIHLANYFILNSKKVFESRNDVQLMK